MLRRAVTQDLRRVMYIVDEIKEEVKEQGSDQFSDDYPNVSHFAEDIDSGNLYVRGIGTEIAGIICISNQEIGGPEDGIRWSKVTPCTSFCRLFVSKIYRRRGVAEELVMLAEDISKRQRLNYIKAAVYELNAPMISLLEKLAFKRVGQINLDSKKYPFYCYEKLL